MQLVLPLTKGHLSNVAIISWQIGRSYKRWTTFFEGHQVSPTCFLPSMSLRTSTTPLSSLCSMVSSCDKVSRTGCGLSIGCPPWALVPAYTTRWQPCKLLSLKHAVTHWLYNVLQVFTLHPPRQTAEAWKLRTPRVEAKVVLILGWS